MGKLKIVMKVQMEDAKKRSKALKVAVGLEGVISAAVDGEKIVVVGDGIDVVKLVISLRKKMGYAELLSVTSAEEKKDEKKDKPTEGNKDVEAIVSHDIEYEKLKNKIESLIESLIKLNHHPLEEAKQLLLDEDEEQQQEPSLQSQKRGDWDTFVRYVSVHQNPALTPEQYTADHVVEFLDYLYQQSFEGRKVIHLESYCPFYGHRNPPSHCPCPFPQSPAFVKALISRLSRVFEDEGGRSESNPFRDGFERWKVHIGQIQAALSGISLLSLSNDADHFEASIAQKIPSFPPRPIYGREKETEELIKLLLRSDSSTDDTSVVSIIGAAGIGKTTLAQIVYSDERVHEHFSLRVWLSLPYQFDLIWLFQAILWCIEEPEGMGKGTSCFKPWLSKTTTGSTASLAMYIILPTLLRDLSEKLAGERFLLVLDDFQMEDPLLMRTLRNHHLVAKIIVTTRKESVAAILQAEEVYHLKGLQEDKCWNLFQENGCLTRDIVNSKQLEYIGKQIIRNCDGVPLAVKMLGSLLRDIQDEKIWYNVLRNMQGSNVTGGVLLQAVRETYEFMPTHLKPCLAYCSAFPRDFKFKKDELVNLWVAEGLIQYRSGSKTIEDIGMEYFDDLQRRSHLKPCLAYCSAFPRGCKLEEDKLAKLWMAEGSQYSGSKTLEDMGTDMWRRSYFHCSDVGIFSLLDLVHDLSEKFEIERDLPQTSSGEAVYGRENDKRKVIKLLLSDDCRKRDVSVIHIVGSGGVGKTTLANLIYNDCTVCEIFETRLWISMNETYDLKQLAKAVIESLTGIFCGLTSLIEIQEALREELMARRFLLVLDNVYNDHDLSFWSSLLVSLSTCAKGSIVIATSRDRILADDLDMDMDMMHFYKLNRLSDCNCWLVFWEHAFKVRDHGVHPDMVEICKRLVSRLEGLPLAARALGDFLCLEQHELWKSILKSELWSPSRELFASGSNYDRLGMLQMAGEQWSENKILPALKLSYNHLTVHVQRCFEYCSLFPKGYIFEKDHLVRLWMSSQGFVEHKEGKYEQDTGNEYFDELLKRSFLQLSSICDPIEKYVMHDHFHDLAQSVSASRCYRTETSKLTVIHEGVRHVSLVPFEFSAEVLFEGFKGPRDIQTLLLINRSIVKWDAIMFHINNPAILFDDLFSHLTCLRTLDLSFTDIEVVPESIANLRHLCYLALNRTKIRSLPESICSLYELQTLELQGCSYLTELPAYIRNLSKLQHLLVWKESGFTFMPSGIGELTGLRTMSTFTVGRDGLHCRIRELKDLMNLRGALCIGGISNVVNVDDAKGAELKIKEHLTTLILQWFNCGEDLEDDQSPETAFEVLQSLQPHSNLEQLTMRDYSGDQFARWMGDPSFLKLTSITLDNCYECSNLPPLGQLPCLKHLSIRMMDGIQHVGHEFCGSGPSRGFPSLETLKLWDMPELLEWSGVEEEYFPCLRNLSISRCVKLRGLPCFPSLWELSIHCCGQLPDLPDLPCLKSLKIDGLQSLVCLPQLNLPALEILEISNCNQLSMMRSLSLLPSLKKLKVTRCPVLNFSPPDNLPSMLQVVEIRGGCALLSNWCPGGFKEITDAHQARRKFVRCKTTTNQGNPVDDFSTCQVVEYQQQHTLNTSNQHIKEYRSQHSTQCAVGLQ